MYPTLPKSYKGSYPFKLATTSYIYPDHIIPNIRLLGPYLDEIELLFFESTPASWPTRHDIREIDLLAEQLDLTYNVHLPLDIELGAADPARRQSDLKTIIQIVDLTLPLSPSTFTLHLPYQESGVEPEHIQKWQECIYQSIPQLLSSGIEPRMISIENLDYPFEWVENIINEINLSVCMDLGHLLARGFEIESIYDKHHQITSIIHLHGVENKKDHLSLDRLSADATNRIMQILKRYEGIVSLEVFSYDNLIGSLYFLEQCWQRTQGL